MDGAAFASWDGQMQTVPDFEIFMPRNTSMGVHAQVVFLLITVLFCLGIGIAWAVTGFTLILPFAGLEMAGLVLAFRVLHRHRGDYERIFCQGNDLVVERRCGTSVQCTRYCRYWVRLIVRPSADPDTCSLFLYQHGRETEIGIHLAADKRPSLAREIRSHLIPPPGG